MRRLSHFCFFQVVFIFLTASIHSANAGDTLWINCGKNIRYADFFPYTTESVKAIWKGGSKKGLAHGKGTLEKYYDDKLTSVFEGTMNRGLMQGNGTYTILNIVKYVGTFNNGTLTGKGTVTYESGTEYTGDLINFSIHGMGTMHYTNGNVSEGFFVKNRLLTGTFTTVTGEVTYYKNYEEIPEPPDFSTSYKPAIGVRVTEFFDEDWKLCAKTKAAYYRLVTFKAPNIPAGKIRDFYISGELQNEFEALYLRADEPLTNFYHGENKLYTEEGDLSRITQYVNNKRQGPASTYFSNGQKSEEYAYDDDELDGPYIQYDSDGHIRRYVYYQEGEKYLNSIYEFDENQICTVYYKEDFEKNKTAWTDNTINATSIITDTGSVLVTIEDGNTHLFYNTSEYDPDYNFRIDMGFQKTSGTETPGYGITWGVDDANNHYEFLISEYGSFAIVKYENGEANFISEWTNSEHININNQYNRLRITKIDDEYQFYVNGVLLTSASDIQTSSSNTGFIVHGNGTYLLDLLLIRNQFNENDSKAILDKIMGKESEDNGEWTGNGSGFFIDQRGFIATNYHVIEDATDIRVEFYQKGVKMSYSAEVVNSDEQNDIAILKINDKSFKTLPPIPYVFSTNLRDLGTDVFTLGYPLADLIGESIKFTDGKISSKSGPDGNISMYQISVPLQPGNSGGPLFDDKGNLVGITSSRLKKEYDAENVNFAIKASYLKNLIEMNDEQIIVPNNTDIYNKKLTDKIKILSDFIPIIKVK